MELRTILVTVTWMTIIMHSVLTTKWTPCDPPIPMYFDYRSVAASKWKLEQTEHDVKQSIKWMSYSHSNLWSTLNSLLGYCHYDSGFYHDSYDMTYDMTFRLDRLDCNPSPQLAEGNCYS